MPSPAAAAAAGGRNRPAAFADLDDSDEETVEEAFDDEEVDDDNGKREQQKPPAAEGSNEDSALSTSSANTNNSSGNPTAAASSPIPNLNGAAPAVLVHAMDHGYATPQRKRQKREATGTAGSAAVEARRPLPALEDSRRLFQRLWTDEDEIVILRGFLDFTSRRGGAAHHHQDTGPFYDQIRARLQLEFNKSQLVEKLRRLKKKYRTLTTRMSSGKDFSFKSPHDQATFELSRQIWGTSNLCSRSAGGGDDDDDVDLTPHQIGDRRKRRRRGRKRPVAEVAATAAAEALVLAAEASVEVKVGESRIPGGMAPVPSVIQETVRSSFSPMFKELVWCAVGGRMGPGGGGLDLEGLRPSLLPLGVGSQSHQVKLHSGAAAVEEEKWRKQQILELEVFSKRMELLQEQIKLLQRELRSAG